MSSAAPLRIKADRFLFPVIFPVSADLAALRDALREKLAMAGDFLRSASLVLDLGEWQSVNAQSFAALLQFIEAEGLHIIGLRNAPETLAARARAQGITLLHAARQAEPEVAPEPQAAAPVPVQGALVLEQPVRSGQQVYARGRDLVALQGVNIGAEVLADGNIFVYGRLAGRALAGAVGDAGARIFATQLALPQLISIAGNFMLSDHPLVGQHEGKSVSIRLQSEDLVFEPLGY